MNWSRDCDSWRSGGFMIDAMSDDDGRWPPFIPSRWRFLLTYYPAPCDRPPECCGIFATLAEAKAAAETIAAAEI
jgi:hypothetical protein